MIKNETKMKKSVYLRKVILDLSKSLMCEFHYDSMQPNNESKLKLCFMDT